MSRKRFFEQISRYLPISGSITKSISGVMTNSIFFSLLGFFSLGLTVSLRVRLVLLGRLCWIMVMIDQLSPHSLPRMGGQCSSIIVRPCRHTSHGCKRSWKQQNRILISGNMLIIQSGKKGDNLV